MCIQLRKYYLKTGSIYMKKTKNIKNAILYLTAIMLIITSAFIPMPAQAKVALTPMPTILSESAILYSVNTGEEIISHNSQEKKYPVTVAKLMTAILAVENADTAANFMPQRTEMVEIGYEITSFKGEYNKCGLSVGQIISLPDLISAMIICDADDAAISIAAYLGRKDLGGIKDTYQKYDIDAINQFVDMMNHKINLIGLGNTHFNNPAGVKTGYQSFSTASDVAKLSKEYLKYDFLREISRISSKKYWRPTTDTTGSVTTPSDVWTSQNELIDTNSKYFYSSCKGLIAGHGVRTFEVEDFDDGKDNELKTEDYAYISAYGEYNGIQVVAVVFGTNKDNAFNDIINMFDYAFKNYVVHTYVQNGQSVAKYKVTNAMDDSNAYLNVVADGGGTRISRIDELDLFDNVIKMNPSYFVPTEDNLFHTYLSPSATILKGDVVGTMDIYYNSVYLDTVTLYAGNTIECYDPIPPQKPSAWYLAVDWSTGIYTTLVIGLILAAFVFLISIFNTINKQRLTRRRYLGTKRKSASRFYGKKKYK